jgi:hypothetical protein
MRVFISWSGDPGRAIAKAVNDWLPAAIQDVRPWFSEEIEKGANWQNELFRELEGTKFSIVILTPEALQSPWIMFETGAAAKAVGKSHACPVLFGMEPADVQGPLASFQLTRFEKDDFFKLFKTINTALGDDKLEESLLQSIFKKWWPDLEKTVSDILTKARSPKPRKRDTNEMVEEVLLAVRAIQNSLDPTPGEERWLPLLRNYVTHKNTYPQYFPHLHEDIKPDNVIFLIKWLNESIRREKESDDKTPPKGV